MLFTKDIDQAGEGIVDAITPGDLGKNGKYTWDWVPLVKILTKEKSESLSMLCRVFWHLGDQQLVKKSKSHK